MKNISNYSKNTPAQQEALDLLLIEATKNSSGEVRDGNGLTQNVARLLAQGANANAVNRDGFTALMLAVENGHTKTVSAFLDCDRIDVNAAGPDGFTALMIAAEKGPTETVSALLACKEIDVNAVDHFDATALIYAAQNCHTEIVSALLACNKIDDVNAVSDYGFTALMFAARNGDTEIVSALLDCKEIDVNVAKKSDGFTALMLAAEKGHTEIVSALLDCKEIDVNVAKKSDGFTALMLAAEKGHTKTVSALLTCNKIDDVNAVNRDVFAALMIAAQNGHAETVSVLLAHKKTNVNALNRDGVTALMLAAENGHTKTVSAFLDCDRINANNANAATSYDGFTALMFAAEKGHTKTVSAFLDCNKININAVGYCGFTSLMLAAHKGHPETVSAFLSRDDVDWQVVQNQLNYPTLEDLSREVASLLAVIIPEAILRNSIIANFNQRNPNNAIQRQDNDIVGAGFEAYNNLNDLKSWHVGYLTDLNVEENEVKNVANQRFFDLLNNQEHRQEALERNNLVTNLVNKSKSLAIDIERIAKEIEVEDQKALDAVMELNPEDFYKLTIKIIDNSKAAKVGAPTLQALSLVEVLREARIDQTSPATTTHHNSTSPLVASKQNLGGGSRS